LGDIGKFVPCGEPGREVFAVKRSAQQMYAIFQRDIPVLQGTIVVLALFFVALNLMADLLQAVLDPRIKRS
jgi:ABC-type dipeptide/oligopeptide/nickel transport system permease component